VTTAATEASESKSKAKSNPKSKQPRAQENETARDKFQRLAPPRVSTAVKKISLIGNLASPGYEYEPEEAKQIVEALTEAVDEVARKFDRRSKSGGKGSFSFQRKR
jgi:hypothetical protein